MSEFVSADISLAYGAVQYICDFNFTHIKVENVSGTTKVLSVPIFFNVNIVRMKGIRIMTDMIMRRYCLDAIFHIICLSFYLKTRRNVIR